MDCDWITLSMWSYASQKRPKMTKASSRQKFTDIKDEGKKHMKQIIVNCQLCLLSLRKRKMTHMGIGALLRSLHSNQIRWHHFRTFINEVYFQVLRKTYASIYLIIVLVSRKCQSSNAKAFFRFFTIVYACFSQQNKSKHMKFQDRERERKTKKEESL